MEETIVLSEDEHIMGLYDKEEDDKMMARSREIHAKNEGISQGIALGIERGLERGLKQGKNEQNISVATNMLKKGSTIEFISEVTGLSKSKIKKLV